MLTDWAEFAALDLKRLYTVMRYPIVVDGRNLFDPRLMQDHGFTYISVGRPAVYPTPATSSCRPPVPSCQPRKLNAMNRQEEFSSPEPRAFSART